MGSSLKADFFSIVGENANVVQSADRPDAGPLTEKAIAAPKIKRG